MFKGLGGGWWGQLPPAQQNVTITLWSSANTEHKQKQGGFTIQALQKYLRTLDKLWCPKNFSIILALLTGPIILAQYALDDCEAFKPMASAWMVQSGWEWGAHREANQTKSPQFRLQHRSWISNLLNHQILLSPFPNYLFFVENSLLHPVGKPNFRHQKYRECCCQPLVLP